MDEITKSIAPTFCGDAIPVVFATNNQFIPVLSVCLRSLLNQISENNLYDLVLIHSGIDSCYIDLLKKMCKDAANVSLRFYDAQNIIRHYKLPVGGHITEETYYRFLIQDILPDYNKVLYLDCDIILCADPAELYRCDLKGKLIGAARDPEFLGRINGANYATAEYCRKKLQMRDPYQYFQAGVLLLNTEEMRKKYSTDYWLSLAQQPFKYHDQDVLNKYCEGQVYYFDMSWNLLTDCDHTRISNIISYAPSEIKEEYFAARKAPKVIHYAGHIKPWYDPEEDFGLEFWEVARNTPFYEVLMSRMINFKTKRKSLAGQMKDVFFDIISFFIPKESRSRMICKKILSKNLWICEKLKIMQ